MSATTLAKLKITVCHTNLLALGGAERVARDVIQAFVASGHDVRGISAYGKPGFVASAPVAVFGNRSLLQRIMRRVMGAKPTVRDLGSQFSRHLPTGTDLIVCCHVSVLPAALEAARDRRIPVILIGHGIEVWRDWTPDVETAIRQCDRVVGVSTYTAESLRRRLGDAVPVDVISPGVNLSHFVATPLADRSDRPLLLTVSRLDAAERYKGHDLVLEALPRIRSRFPGVRYAIVGRGNDAQRLKDLALHHGVAACTRFYESCDDAQLAELYREADLFVMPSRTGRSPDGSWAGEGFGIVYAEAAACGRASIAAHEGGQVDIVKDRKTGRLVPPTAPDVADAVIECLADRSMLARMGLAAREHVESCFTIQIFNSRWCSAAERTVHAITSGAI